MEEKEKEKLNKEGETAVSPLSLHNIYKNIKISVRTLDKIIVGLIIALFIVLFIGMQNRGFTIEFDSQGGTSIEIQKKMYGDKIDREIPEREGYEFAGWSLYPDCSSIWNMEDEVTGSMKLYACWVR